MDYCVVEVQEECGNTPPLPARMRAGNVSHWRVWCALAAEHQGEFGLGKFAASPVHAHLAFSQKAVRRAACRSPRLGSCDGLYAQHGSLRVLEPLGVGRAAPVCSCCAPARGEARP